MSTLTTIPDKGKVEGTDKREEGMRELREALSRGTDFLEMARVKKFFPRDFLESRPEPKCPTSKRFQQLLVRSGAMLVYVPGKWEVINIIELTKNETSGGESEPLIRKGHVAEHVHNKSFWQESTGERDHYRIFLPVPLGQGQGYLSQSELLLERAAPFCNGTLKGADVELREAKETVESLVSLTATKLCRPNLAQLLWFLMLNERVNGERLFQNSWCYTSTPSDQKKFFALADFTKEGLDVLTLTPQGTKEACGVLSIEIL